MDFILSPVEARVLGCLIEKEMQTPDYYPLSLNSLVNACNQKSCREPVMELNESAVSQALYELRQKKLANQIDTIGYRASKFEHLMDEKFQFSDQEMAVMCLLLLRGPQTPGELRTRSGRSCEFNSPEEVEQTMQGLMEKESGPFVVKLPRQPGRRENRYMHLFYGPVTPEDFGSFETPKEGMVVVSYDQRISAMESEIASLKSELDAFRQRFDEFIKQF
ncbi:MAG: hypothetical protein A2020_11710 [Lentisphaerae bacterium GWF2_45_14]|nr:MAG: hypothetical protein A2020_11710 [Lentisphaerae bacterium GWF2_45_14]